MLRLLTIVAALLCAGFSDAKLREGDCEVCLKVVQTFIDDVKANKLKNQEKIEKSMKKSCKGFKDNREKRMCYYIGGTDDAATGMLRTLSGPLKNGLPADKICEKLKKKDAQICELRYEKEIDVATLDLKKTRVKVCTLFLREKHTVCCGLAPR